MAQIIAAGNGFYDQLKNTPKIDYKPKQLGKFISNIFLNPDLPVYLNLITGKMEQYKEAAPVDFPILEAKHRNRYYRLNIATRQWYQKTSVWDTLAVKGDFGCFTVPDHLWEQTLAWNLYADL